MGWLRVGGTGRDRDGSTVTWSVAEGRRGRRWREVVAERGSVVHLLLMELDPEGRFAHLELSTAAGLLTLHPEGDGTIHGNAITASGITHVRGMPWHPTEVIVIDRSVICKVVAGQWQRVHGLHELGAVRITPDLGLTRIRIAIPNPPVDDRGLPALDESRQWSLEEHGQH